MIVRELKKVIYMVYKVGGKSYIKGEKIGWGGNGDVFELLEENYPNKKSEYVLKELKKKSYKDDKRYTRFKKEIEIQRKGIKGVMPILKHNVPDNPTESDKPWYIMPEATPLKKVLSQDNYSGEKKVKLMLDVAKILKKLHEKGYAHRDLKPENLLFLDGKILISDFGLVKEVDSSGITKEGEKVGPYKTIAPEMLKDASTISNARPADVYSFAKTLWLLINGLEKHLTGIYRRDDCPLNTEGFNDDYIEELHELLEKSTETESGSRPEISEIVEILEEWFSIIGDEKKLEAKKGILALKQAAAETIADEEIYQNEKAFNFINVLKSKRKKYVFKVKYLEVLLPKK